MRVHKTILKRAIVRRHTTRAFALRNTLTFPLLSRVFSCRVPSFNDISRMDAIKILVRECARYIRERSPVERNSSGLRSQKASRNCEFARCFTVYTQSDSTSEFNWNYPRGERTLEKLERNCPVSSRASLKTCSNSQIRTPVYIIFYTYLLNSCIKRLRIIFEPINKIKLLIQFVFIRVW